jgi:hypothetical protein
MTDLEVANYALGLLGQYKISVYPDIPEQPTVYGQALATYLPFAINDLMIDGDWNFARKRVELTPSTTVIPLFGYSHAFPLPTDLVTIISINGEPWENQLQFAQIEGEFIYANTDLMRLVYLGDIKNKTTTQEFPSILQPLLGIRWAQLSCVRITNNIELYNMLADMYLRELSRLRENDYINNTGGRYNYFNKLMRQSGWNRIPYGTTFPFGGHNKFL